MYPKKIFRQLFPSYFIVATIPLLMSVLFIFSSLKNFYIDQMRSNLESRAYLIAEYLNSEISDSTTNTSIDSICKVLGNKSKTRITIILPDGVVIAESDYDVDSMSNHGNRPEIKTAFTGATGSYSRFSTTLEQNMLYVSLPLKKSGDVIAVIRTSIPIISIDIQLKKMFGRVLTITVILLVISLFFSVIFSRRIARPIQKLRDGAERFAQGDLNFKLPIPESEELSDLTETLNRMASQLNDRFQIITNQRNEQQAILKSMSEGVIAVDSNDKIIILNQAAAEILKIRISEATGKHIHEVIRISEIQRCIEKALKSPVPINRDIILLTNRTQEQFIQVHGTMLSNSRGETIGALAVLNDVTNLKHFENMQKEFVANVSHELRTPLTSIKGFVETLCDGAINDPTEATRFLNIIQSQTDRLTAIVEDLLTISRIEKEIERDEVPLETDAIFPVLNAAILLCIPKATEKYITLEPICENKSLSAPINRFLLEQALINLIDNAIKYSEHNSTVYIGTKEQESCIEIFVRDEGSGIAKEHLPHLFERFYRVDKARSRSLGGTGLGLAIVNNIVRAHHGKVGVESLVGKGSTFTITLPVKSI